MLSRVTQNCPVKYYQTQWELCPVLHTDVNIQSDSDRKQWPLVMPQFPRALQEDLRPLQMNGFGHTCDVSVWKTGQTYSMMYGRGMTCFDIVSHARRVRRLVPLWFRLTYLHNFLMVSHKNAHVQVPQRINAPACNTNMAFDIIGFSWSLVRKRHASATIYFCDFGGPLTFSLLCLHEVDICSFNEMSLQLRIIIQF